MHEGWSHYIELTYSIGALVENGSAVHYTEMLVVSDDEEAPGTQARFCYPKFPIIPFVLIIEAGRMVIY